jgi:hypothetical protein
MAYECVLARGGVELDDGLTSSVIKFSPTRDEMTVSIGELRECDALETGLPRVVFVTLPSEIGEGDSLPSPMVRHRPEGTLGVETAISSSISVHSRTSAGMVGSLEATFASGLVLSGMFAASFCDEN